MEMNKFEYEQRIKVQKLIEKTKYYDENGLCYSCGQNKATTYNQLFAPICQECRDRLENS